MAPEAADDPQRSALEARVGELEAELVTRDVRASELEGRIAKLVAQVEELTEKLGRNSSNSHLPPSSDGPGAAARGAGRSKKQPSGRKRGGQKGHSGAHRGLLPADRVDSFVELFPDSCEGCAALLPRTPDLDARRYQVLELMGCTPHVTEFRRHEGTCVRCDSPATTEAWFAKAY